MKILFCGRLSDINGETERTVDLPPEVTDANLLRQWLGSTDPALLRSLHDPSVKILVNDELAHGNPSLCQEDEVAFLPPIGGG